MASFEADKAAFGGVVDGLKEARTTHYAKAHDRAEAAQRRIVRARLLLARAATLANEAHELLEEEATAVNGAAEKVGDASGALQGVASTTNRAGLEQAVGAVVQLATNASGMAPIIFPQADKMLSVSRLAAEAAEEAKAVQTDHAGMAEIHQDEQTGLNHAIATIQQSAAEQ